MEVFFLGGASAAAMKPAGRQGFPDDQSAFSATSSPVLMS
jgi:hypothetical protein